MIKYSQLLAALFGSDGAGILAGICFAGLIWLWISNIDKDDQ